MHNESGKHSITERIMTIMKYKRSMRIVLACSILLIIGTTLAIVVSNNLGTGHLVNIPVEVTKDNDPLGTDSHVFKVYSENGDRLVFQSRPEFTLMEISDSVSSIAIDDEILLSYDGYFPESLPNQESISVKPHLALITGRGKTIPLDIAEINIYTQKVDLSVGKPTLMSESEVLITGHIQRGVSATLFINDMDISEFVDDKGYFSYAYQLINNAGSFDPIANHKVIVRAQAPQMRACAKSFSVENGYVSKI